MHGKTIYDRVGGDRKERDKVVGLLKRTTRRVLAGGSHPFLIATVEPMVDETGKTKAAPAVLAVGFEGSTEAHVVIDALLIYLEKAGVLKRKDGLDDNLGDPLPEDKPLPGKTEPK